jgi:AraC-like DNA-binding protein
MQRVEIDFKVLDALLQCNASRRDCAKYFKCSEDTVERRIKEKTGQTFSDYAEPYRDGNRLRLHQKALQLANSGII